MNNSNNSLYSNAPGLINDLHHHLVDLAASLQDRLSTAERESLGKAFQAQIYLQLLVDEGSLKGDKMPAPSAAEDQLEAWTSQVSLRDMQGILTQLALYAKLIYNETVGDEESEAATYATQISKIAADAQEQIGQKAKLILPISGQAGPTRKVVAELIPQQATKWEWMR